MQIFLYHLLILSIYTTQTKLNRLRFCNGKSRNSHEITPLAYSIASLLFRLCQATHDAEGANLNVRLQKQ